MPLVEEEDREVSSRIWGGNDLRLDRDGKERRLLMSSKRRNSVFGWEERVFEQQQGLHLEQDGDPDEGRRSLMARGKRARVSSWPSSCGRLCLRQLSTCTSSSYALACASWPMSCLQRVVASSSCGAAREALGHTVVARYIGTSSCRPSAASIDARLIAPLS